MLILSRKIGESVLLNDEIELKITDIVGDRVKIGISAPKDCKIMRKELCQTVESNKQAASGTISRENLMDLMASLLPNEEKGSE